MTEFWWGVIALPAALVALAVLIAVPFGAWLLLEMLVKKWMHGRFFFLPAVEPAEPIEGAFRFWTMPKWNLRDHAAVVMLTAAHVFGMKLLPRVEVVFIHHGKRNAANDRLMRSTLQATYMELTKEDAE